MDIHKNGYERWEMRYWKNVKFQDFKNFVEQAAEEIPDDVLVELDNVAFVAEPGDEDSPLGEYVGVPRVDRSDLDIAPLPDRIVLYHTAIEDECDGDPKKIREEISRTLWHEIAHHLGWDDDRVEEMEKRRGWK